MSESTSYKVSLSGTDQNVEVRRFLVSNEQYGNFKNLEGKLISVFPVLRLRKYSIFWTDSEGDEVTVASDEDLLIAITEMEGPVYKLTVKTAGEDKLQDEFVPSSDEEESIRSRDSPSDNFQRWSGVFNNMNPTGFGGSPDSVGQSNINHGENNLILPPVVLTILQFLGINLNSFPCLAQPRPSTENAENIIKYIVSQFMKMSAMFTRASITMSSFVMVLLTLMILPSFIVHSALYLGFASSLGLPLPTLITGHLLYALISCSPSFLVAAGSIWAFHRIYVQRKPLLDVDMDMWRRRFESLSARLQENQI